MKKTLLLLGVMLCSICIYATPKQQTVCSPDGRLTVTVKDGVFSVDKAGQKILADTPISISTDCGMVFAPAMKNVRVRRRIVDNMVNAVNYKKASVRDNFNEMILSYKDFDVIFRAYDDAAAYRFVSKIQKPLTIVSEKADFTFADDFDVFVPYVRFDGEEIPSIEDQYLNSFENAYTKTKISGWDARRLAFLPVTAQTPDGKCICITETDLKNFPGMHLANVNSDKTLEAMHARYPKTLCYGYHNIQRRVSERENYLCRALPAQAFPWRIVIVADNPAELLNSDTAYNLAPRAAENDWSWVKPGKVAWDWWNNWNVTGVDFKAGINTDTYKYYIDFASAKGIEYVILDEGWSTIGTADLMDVVPEINLEELCSYASQKGVGLILWAGYQAFAKDVEGLCRHYSAMGIKGFKVDFLDTDDAQIVDFVWDAAAIAAKYRMVLDYHGVFKPIGDMRMYPNVLNHEGVFGQEMMKFSPHGNIDQPRNNCIIPFARMVAGPIDYTQGAMSNGTKESFRMVNSEPMSQGTRVHQLALYSIFEAPLTMLCDSPSNYLKETECTDFIAGIPTVWDETIGLDSKIGEYVAVARRKGDVWYVGAITDWTERDLVLDLNFLGEGKHKATVFRDGVNADRNAADYKRLETELEGGKTSIHLAPGGGWTAKITNL